VALDGVGLVQRQECNKWAFAGTADLQVTLSETPIDSNLTFSFLQFAYDVLRSANVSTVSLDLYCPFLPNYPCSDTHR
jgi:hypothetical protein